MKKHVVIVSVIAAALVALVVGITAVSKQDSADGNARSLTNSASGPRWSTRFGTNGEGRWQPGVTRHYRLQSERSVTIQAKEGDRNAMRLALSGTWRTTVTDVDEQTVRLRIVFHEPAVVTGSAQGQIDHADLDTMKKELAQPFYATANKRGRVQTLHLPQGLSPTVQTLLRSTVASVQFASASVDGTDPAAEWEVEEEDPTGEYVARYQRSEAGTIEKRNVGYVRLTTPAGLVSSDHIGAMEVESTTRFELTDEGAVAKAEGSERIEIQASLTVPTILASTTTHLVLTKVTYEGQWVDSFAALGKNLLAVRLSHAAAAKKSQTDLDQQLLGDATFASLMADLRSALDGNDDRVVSKFLRKWAALFRLQPESTRRAAQAVLESDDEELSELLIGSLAAAETPEAQAALVDVVNSPEASTRTRTDGASALGLADVPTDDTVAALQRLVDDNDPEVHNSALLGLGSASRNSSPETSADLIEDLLRRWAQAGDVDTKVLLLEALGNTADVRILPAVEQALASALSPVRGAAARALRLVPVAAADSLLASALRDLSPSVRQAALFATGYRQLSPLFAAVSQVMTQDSVAAVRLDAVQVIGGRMRELVDAPELLAWVVHNDPDQEVRDAAETYIEAL